MNDVVAQGFNVLRRESGAHFPQDLYSLSNKVEGTVPLELLKMIGSEVDDPVGHGHEILPELHDHLLVPL